MKSCLASSTIAEEQSYIMGHEPKSAGSWVAGGAASSQAPDRYQQTNDSGGYSVCFCVFVCCGQVRERKRMK